MADIMNLDLKSTSRHDDAIKAMHLKQMQTILLDDERYGDLGNWYFDMTEQRLYLNPLMLLTAGIPMESIDFSYSMETFIKYVLSEDRLLFEGEFKRHQSNKSSIVEFVFRIEGKDHELHHIFISGKKVDEQWRLPYIIGEAFDVTKQYVSKSTYKKMNETKLVEVTKDSLTGLLKKTYFEEQLRHSVTLARAGQQSFCLLGIDMDFFSNINNHFGRDKGDRVLEEIGVILKRETRGSDIVGRYGGDRFYIALVNVNNKTGQMIAERIKKSITNHMFIGGIRTSISGGLVTYNKESYEDLLTGMEALIQKSKQSGHNCMSY